MNLNIGGRPKIGPDFKTKLPQVVHDRIAELAAADGVTRSAWARRVLTEATKEVGSS